MERYRALLSRPAPEHPTLADAQHALAVQLGFASWPTLKAHVEAIEPGAEPAAMLMAAIKADDPSAAHRVLQEHPELKARLNDPIPGSDFGATPLLAAMPWANREMIDVLLEAGADINQRSHWWAGGFGVLDDDRGLASFLIERGARVDVGCEADLLMVSALGDLERVRRRLDDDPAAIRMTVSERWFPKRDPRSGGTIYIWTLGGHKTAHVIAREFGHEQVLALLMERSSEELKLGLACELGDEALFARLLAGRPDLSRTLTDDDRQKLVTAAESNNTNALHLLLAAGWPLDVRGQHGGTPLHWAAWHGNTAMVRELLRYQAAVNVKGDDHDLNPLGWALHGSGHSWHRHTGDYAGVVEALREAGATVPERADGFEASETALAALRRHSRAT